MISPYDWLEAIKEDIRKKYSVESPEFLVDGMSLDKKTFDEIAKPLQKAAKQIGLTKTDLKKTLREVRNVV